MAFECTANCKVAHVLHYEGHPNAALFLAKGIPEIRAGYVGIMSHYPPISATINPYERMCLNVRSVSELTDIVATL
jgi:hypothetical protein